MNPQGRSFGIPALFPMRTLQQSVITSGGLPTAVSMAPLSTFPAMPPTSITQPLVAASMPKPSPPARPLLPTANLYLCRTSHNATEPPSDEGDDGKEKTSLELLQQDFNDLNSRKLKDSLSSFLPDIPGDFDSASTTNTMLKNLLEQRAIGNREFLPLSGPALLGFRLLPGSLPEQYRIDPPALESKHHHKRKKHKRKQIEKMAEDNGDSGPPAPKAKMPSDAFTFIKQESQHSHHLASQGSHQYGFGGGPASQATSVIQQSSKPMSGHPFSQPMGGGGVVTTGAMGASYVLGSGHPIQGGKRKKEKKKNKEKKKEKKEKKKKREKHHGQDGSGAPPGGGGSGPTLQPHPQMTYSNFPPHS